MFLVDVREGFDDPAARDIERDGHTGRHHVIIHTVVYSARFSNLIAKAKEIVEHRCQRGSTSNIVTHCTKGETPICRGGDRA